MMTTTIMMTAITTLLHPRGSRLSSFLSKAWIPDYFPMFVHTRRHHHRHHHQAERRQLSFCSEYPGAP
jgi:hypothetical protein